MCQQDCNLEEMATQEVSHELDVPVYGTVFIYCGLCAVNRPTEPLRRIGKAGGQRFQQVGFEFLRDFFDDPGALSSLEYIDPEPQLVDQPADWWKRAKLQKIRTGVLYEVLRNAHRIDYQEFAADVNSRQFRPDLPNLGTDILHSPVLSQNEILLSRSGRRRLAKIGIVVPGEDMTN